MADEVEPDLAPVSDDAEADVEAHAELLQTEPPGLQPAPATVAEQRCSAPVPEPASAEVLDDGWQAVKPKRRGRPPGSKNKPKIVALPPEPVEPEPIEEEPVQPEPPKARHRAPNTYTRASMYAPPALGHRDLSSVLSEHLLQVETQKRLSQQEMYARLVRGVL